MNAVAEGDAPLTRAPQIERVRIAQVLFVAVGRSEEHDRPLSFADDLAPQASRGDQG
jgi:hypothetical protein